MSLLWYVLFLHFGIFSTENFFLTIYTNLRSVVLVLTKIIKKKIINWNKAEIK